VTRVIRIQTTGGPDVLELAEVELAPPAHGEVRVRHTAVGVNFVDCYQRSGLYPVELPAVLGVEAAAVVEAVGEGVELAVGTRVAYADAGLGAYADARNVTAARLLTLPDDISDATAAAVLLKGMTAEYLVRRTYEVRAGDSVLVFAAAGGVGLILGQWLKALGARPIGVVGSEEKAALARQHGYADVLVGFADLVSKVRELTGGRGVPVVYDSIGKDTLHASLDCLSVRGVLVSFGNSSGKPDPVEPAILAQKGSVYLTRPRLADYVRTREELTLSAESIFTLVRQGVVNVHVGQRFALADAAEAHRALESRATTGACLLFP
jgi:NADPH:quinone reductase